MKAHIFQINISDGGVPKLAIPKGEVTPLGLVGDRQINTHVHGGPERAVCLYSLERLLDLQEEGHPIFPGAMGENITLTGVDWESVRPGTRFEFAGGVCLEVTRYTTPCDALTDYFLDGKFVRVSEILHPGWARVYTRVLATGLIRVGETVEVSFSEQSVA